MQDERAPGVALALGTPLATALFASGFAALTNQVVWQRALKTFLGGSETIASMVVVLVFMLGLGLGSLAVGRRAATWARPLRALALLELLLAGVNLLVCLVLGSGLEASVRQVQVLAQASGVPLLGLYALGALLLLFVPTFLMGATLPVASEACQRALGHQDRRVLPLLFFVNTLGSALGALAGTFYLVPAWGLTASMVAGAGANLLAGVLLLGLRAKGGEVPAALGGPEPPVEPPAPRPLFPPRPEEALALGLGFASLGYEMALLRIAVMRYSPLPSVFATVLTGFLLYWSLGTWLAARLDPRRHLAPGLGLTGVLLCAVPLALLVVGGEGPRGLGEALAFLLRGAPYFLPPLGFGVLFGLLLTHAARRWGEDVGRLAAWNTLGSCLGTAGVTLVGYEMDWLLLPPVLGLVVLALQPLAPGASGRSLPRGLAAAALAALALSWDFTGALSRGKARFFFGSDGAIYVWGGRNMVWDGLWHSALSDGTSHLGTRNWHIAVAPVLAHPTGEIRRACVVGLGTGITAATLAKLESVEEVVAYDITLTVREVLEAYPEGTLHALENPKLTVRWEDARMGMALREDERFDLVQAQPLYLKQAGSGLLNSVEFYRLVQRRLRPGGVFCLYSNGTPGQAFVARQTAQRVFAHGESFLSGYLLVLSDHPLRLGLGSLEPNLRPFAWDPFWEELAAYPGSARTQDLLALVDRPRLPWGDGRLVSTDDHPRIEYPRWIETWIRELGYPHELPEPRGGGRGAEPVRR